ncbi:MAG: type II toxin-antitoxin system RelE/ParE family toxin [bacterium]
MPYIVRMSKRYEVSRKRSVLKSMRRFPKDVRLDIEEALESLTTDPRPKRYDSGKVKGAPYRRLIVGGYRVVYDVDDKKKTVVVIEVTTREGAYRKR